MRIAVIGAGNGGQALSGYLASIGHIVNLFDRNIEIVKELQSVGSITLQGQLDCKGQLNLISNQIDQVIKRADLIMVATTATAHVSIAEKIANFLEEGQIIVLNPGRTGGALEFKNALIKYGCSQKVYVAEAQTLVYACRIIENGIVYIIGVKDKVLLSAIPSSDTKYVLEVLKPLFNCFIEAKNVLSTSFENIGAIFHPSVVLFNEAAIERGHKFFFYREMTPSLAQLIEKIDKERLMVAKEYGLNVISAKDWISYAYDNIKGDTLCERMQNNPAYYEILAPTTINCRQITEDVPTGLVPFSELGKAAGVKTPIMDALITICSELLDVDFRETGRNLKNLGFLGCDVKQIIEKIS